MTENEMALMLASVAVDMQDKDVNDVLDKIRAEIEEIETYDGLYIDRAYVLQIIDEYRAESEG